MPVAVPEPRVEAPFELVLHDEAELEGVAARLRLDAERPCLVLVGGADGLGAADVETLEGLFADVLAPLVASVGAVVVDGATDTGVMRLMGRARAAGSHTFPLVGVVPGALADWGLEPNHSHVVLVPGREWGDETPWISSLAGALAGARGSATLLVNGGEISWADAEASVARGRPVVAVAGSGRTADAIAAGADERAARLATSGLVHAVDLADPGALERLLLDLLRA